MYVGALIHKHVICNLSLFVFCLFLFQVDRDLSCDASTVLRLEEERAGDSGILAAESETSWVMEGPCTQRAMPF